MAEAVRYLSYTADGWLYKQSRRAWGYLKAIEGEDDKDRRDALLGMMDAEDRALVRDARRMSDDEKR